MFVLAPLIPLLVGRGFAESVSALRWLCLIPVFRSIHGATGSVLTGAGLAAISVGNPDRGGGGKFWFEPVVDTESTVGWGRHGPAWPQMGAWA